MTNENAAALLERDAAEVRQHSQACRAGTAETYEIWSEGCAACSRHASEVAAAEAAMERSAFAAQWETNDEHRAEMERDDAWFGRG